MRLELTERLAKLLFDPIHLMEKSAPIDLQLAAAQLPVRTEQEMILEHLVLPLGESPPAHQTEVSDELFVFQSPHGFALATRIRLQGHAADVLLLGGALPEPRVAGAENGAKYAITRG